MKSTYKLFKILLGLSVVYVKFEHVAGLSEQERLFEQLVQLINNTMAASGKQKRAAIRQLVCKVQEIQTTLLKHLSKEEEQLFPLLLQHFTFAEQVGHVSSCLFHF